MKNLVKFFTAVEMTREKNETSEHAVERRIRQYSSNEHLALRDEALAFAARCARGVDYDGVGGPNPFVVELIKKY
jgi:hypothetical protein